LSRSRHATRRALREEARWDWRSPEARKPRLAELRKDLREKRTIKRQVIEERRDGGRAVLEPVDVDAIPIRVKDEGLYVHYPAGPEDLREVLRRLPPGIANGIEAIELVLGREVQEEFARKEGLDPDVDPFTGRRGAMGPPGVHCGHVLGTYWSPGGLVSLYAYVYDPAFANRSVKETYLALRFLCTFVHEIAHHEDRMLRMGRGRWRYDSKEKKEAYAESTARAWVEEAAVPYLREKHGARLAELESWIEAHAGVRIPCEWLCGDPRSNEVGDLSRVFGGIVRCFEDLLEDVESGEDARTIRRNLALHVHYNGHYAFAIEVVDALIREDPDDLESLTARADFLNHLDRNEEASEILRRVLSRNPDLEEAWHVGALVARDVRDWAAVLEATENDLRLAGKRSSYIVALQARALLELGRLEELAERIAELKGVGRDCPKADAFALEAVALLRTGRLDEALAAAGEGLAILGSKTWRDTRPELRAARFDALCRLGRRAEAAPLDETTFEALERRGYEEWVLRLRALAR